MSDWTSTDRSIRTPYGTIHYGGSCQDHYANMEAYDQGGGHTSLTLQRPAMRAFKAAQVRLAKRLGWDKGRLEKDRDGKAISVLPGTNRSCETQYRLWRSDSSRYADPKYTGHTRGLAIDVSQAQANLSKIRDALHAEGWKQARSDEPWHYSFHVSI